MARRFKYNPETCRYEPIYLTAKDARNHVFIFLAFAFAFGFIGYLFYQNNVGSFDEINLTQKNHKLTVEWQALQNRVHEIKADLNHLIDKDDLAYRPILDMEPLEESVRKAGVGGSEKFDKSSLENHPLLLTGFQAVYDLKNQLDIEVQSYQLLHKLSKEKVESWASRPAIQPIHNKQLNRLYLSYGPRFHPILKVTLDHKGLDFVAPTGTPVYATGDGTVEMAYHSDTYGNVIYLNHGHDFETRYAHLSKFAVKVGEKVKRGQLIGHVGNTGRSQSPHLHYEVLLKGSHVNPINFFQRDLSNQEYQKLIEVGSQQTEFLD
jgi:murein DD-endopeptidase MepM/ murein hydrolase activator NlpD